MIAETLTTTQQADPSVASQLAACLIFALCLYGLCVALAGLIGMLEVVRTDVRRSLRRVQGRYREALWERHVNTALLLANEWDVHCAEAFLVARSWQTGRVPRVTYAL